MALYRFEAKVISRSGGSSTLNAAAYRSGKTVTSAAAYRHRTALTDERSGTTYDYSRKRGVEGSVILAPADVPGWAHDREQLWNEVERVEKRKDSQLARDFVISLPHELEADQRRALLAEFLNRAFVDRGYLCDVAYHAPHGKGDDRNHHAHVMVSMRKIDAQGFAARKDRPEGNPTQAWQAELAQLRKDWADTTNRHLEAAGRPERVSHLSLVAQGIDRQPEPKQGPIATEIERQGRESYAGNDRRRIIAENADRARLKLEMAASADSEPATVSRPAEHSTHGTDTVDEAQQRQAQGLTRRARMDEPLANESPTDEVLARQAQRLVEHWRQLAEANQRLQAFRQQKETEGQEARSTETENRRRQEERQRAGDIADAGTRHSVALGQAGGANVYQTMANAALIEGATFKKEQEALRRRASSETDSAKRDEIELRRHIEACEYMAVTSRRLAGISATLAGREDHPSATADRERAQYWQEQATKGREERAAKQADRDRQEREGVANQLGTLRKDLQRSNDGSSNHPAPAGSAAAKGKTAEQAEGGQQQKESQPTRQEALAAYARARNGQPGTGKDDRQAETEAGKTASPDPGASPRIGSGAGSSTGQDGGSTRGGRGR